MSLPNTNERGFPLALNSSLSISSLKLTPLTWLFGTSIPTEVLPGIGASTRIEPLLARVIAISSAICAILLTEIPLGIVSSYLVTAGPT